MLAIAPAHCRKAGRTRHNPRCARSFLPFPASRFQFQACTSFHPRALLISPLLPPYGDRFPRVMACCAAAPNTRNAASACPALSPARLSMRHAAAVRCELLAGATSKHHLQLADQSALRILISGTPHQANPKAALSFPACAWGKRKVAHGPVVSHMHHQHVGGCYGTVPLWDSVANARPVCFVIAPVRPHFSAAPHFAARYLAFHLRSHCAVRHDSAHCTISNMPSRTNAPVRSTRIGFVWFALYARALVASCPECGMWCSLLCQCPVIRAKPLSTL